MISLSPCSVRAKIGGLGEAEQYPIAVGLIKQRYRRSVAPGKSTKSCQAHPKSRPMSLHDGQRSQRSFPAGVSVLPGIVRREHGWYIVASVRKFSRILFVSDM